MGKEQLTRGDSPDASSAAVEHVGIGPRPKFTDLPRWCSVADIPKRPLPVAPHYRCHRTSSKPRIDGEVASPEWPSESWAGPLVTVEDGGEANPPVLVAFQWDNRYLYAAFRVTDTDIRASTVHRNAHVYLTDNDVEVFVEFDGGYYEVGLNAINTVYELRWTWLDRLIDEADWPAFEELLKIPDVLYYTHRGGERLGRIADRDFHLDGLRHAVRIDGSLNNPSVPDNGWTAELAIPWQSLDRLSRRRMFPPKAGDVVRIQVCAMRHRRDLEGGSPFGEGTPFTATTWSVMGNTNVHNPERWVTVSFE